ncbi:hypothetical protein [Vitiosangium sp. GDMCC 1.1324]|uniref:hypothetical protein n=1 Tax=Vitiosangium sp. (strain GDMCC 1.1324) TaxID=2138576 RepID=UPI00130EAF30|nr:hypothetical protein [Vitiosangium sp. GDMCC 1.1324]
MRTSMPSQGRNPAMTREKSPPTLDANRGFGARGTTERPASIRDAIIRWLNEEL